MAPRDAVGWCRCLAAVVLILVRLWLFPAVYLLERRRRNRTARSRRFSRWRTIKCITRIIINGILEVLRESRPPTRSGGKVSTAAAAAPPFAATTAAADADADDSRPSTTEDPWVTAHQANALKSPLYRIPEEVLLHVMENLDAPALYCLRQSCRRGLRLVAPDVVTANAPAPWEMETGGGGRAGGGSGGGLGGIRGGMGGGGGITSVLLGGRSAWGCAAEPPWQQYFVTARELIGQALRRDLLCTSCRDVRSGWERPLAVVNAVRRGLRCDGCRRPNGEAKYHPALLFSAQMRAARPPAGGRLCRGREGRIRLCAHVTIGWDQVESAACSVAKEQRRGDRRVILRCMHKSHDFGERIDEDWEVSPDERRQRRRVCRDAYYNPTLWMQYPEVIVEPPPRGGAFGWKPDPTAREEKDAVASVLVRRMSSPFYLMRRPASVEELLQRMREVGLHKTITTCPHMTFDDVVRRSFDPNACACIGRGKIAIHHQHEEPSGRCCMCYFLQSGGKESIFCDAMEPCVPWSSALSDDDEGPAAAATPATPWCPPRPYRAKHRPTRHGTACNECLSEYWWISHPGLAQVLRLVSMTPDWGVDGPLDPRWLRLIDAGGRAQGSGSGDAGGGSSGGGAGPVSDEEQRDPLTRNLLWCPSGDGRRCAIARRGRAWGHGLERARDGIFELGHVYLNTGAIGSFFATLANGGDRIEPSRSSAPRSGRGGVGFLSQEMILGGM